MSLDGVDMESFYIKPPLHISSSALGICFQSPLSCLEFDISTFAQYCGRGSLTKWLPIIQARHALVTHDLRTSMAYSNNCFSVIPHVHFFSDLLSLLQHLAKSSWQSKACSTSVCPQSPKSCLEAISFFVISSDGFLTVALLAPKSVSRRLGSDLTLHLGPVSVG